MKIREFIKQAEKIEADLKVKTMQFKQRTAAFIRRMVWKEICMWKRKGYE